MSFDGIHTADDGAAPAAAAVHTGSLRHWRTNELAILRQHYPQGAEAVQVLLPHRTLGAIRARAAALGVRGQPPRIHKPLRKKYTSTPQIDMAIREGYAHATKRGAIKALSVRLALPDWWVHLRAAQLGVARSNATRAGQWCAAERELLEQHASCSLAVIAKRLRAAGYDRSVGAVANMLRRASVDRTDPDRWSTQQLAVVMGVSPTTVLDWAARRGLPVRRDGAGGAKQPMAHRKALKAWIAANPALVDLRRVDQAWFWEVMF